MAVESPRPCSSTAVDFSRPCRSSVEDASGRSRCRPEAEREPRPCSNQCATRPHCSLAPCHASAHPSITADVPPTAGAARLYIRRNSSGCTMWPVQGGAGREIWDHVTAAASVQLLTSRRVRLRHDVRAIGGVSERPLGFGEVEGAVVVGVEGGEEQLRVERAELRGRREGWVRDWQHSSHM